MGLPTGSEVILVNLSVVSEETCFVPERTSCFCEMKPGRKMSTQIGVLKSYCQGIVLVVVLLEVIRDGVGHQERFPQDEMSTPSKIREPSFLGTFLEEVDSQKTRGGYTPDPPPSRPPF